MGIRLGLFILMCIKALTCIRGEILHELRLPWVSTRKLSLASCSNGDRGGSLADPSKEHVEVMGVLGIDNTYTSHKHSTSSLQTEALPSLECEVRPKWSQSSLVVGPVAKTMKDMFQSSDTNVYIGHHLHQRDTSARVAPLLEG